ncbi:MULTISPECIES: helix-turn-helix domain-containing protein [unclassified Sphingobacterium]|uniref:helix-turn-helix domain-containing protein n=1 Tax=unclassified Sphingobacterium TaxID=2609468 RepID=UPI0025F36443|nr:MULTISPECIES: helix-turn-helix domain-containing protein [unclassified Sphingobacterium]
MRKRTVSIPIRTWGRDYGNGIAVINMESEIPGSKEFNYAHRHDYHLFVLQESGISHTEIDFKQYFIDQPTIIYQSPNQVHRALKVKQLSGFIMTMSNENLHADYLKILQMNTPVEPLTLSSKTDLAIIREAFSLCKKLFDRRDDKLYDRQVRDSCNTLVGLFMSQFLKQTKDAEKLSRFEIVHKAFTGLLEQNFVSMKRPADYAAALNISVAYLNECVKNATGVSVSYQIQQRIILEAKRLLYHSDRSVKEVAIELGYDDYPYFSRLFTKVAGVTALTFRRKNHD